MVNITCFETSFILATLGEKYLDGAKNNKVLKFTTHKLELKTGWT